MRTTVFPASWSFFSMSSTSRPVWESSAPVGSSAKITAGSPASARAMDTRCCWPPESWLGLCFSLSPSPTSSSASFARSRRSALDTPAYIRETSTFSCKFSFGRRLYCWKMKPSILFRISASWFRFIWPTSCPSSRYAPEVGTSRQPMMFIQVDFPLPDCPTIATNSPF